MGGAEPSAGGRLSRARVALLLASALLHALAFPPWSLTGLAWVALAPFLLALRGLDPWRGFAAGWIWGSAACWGVAYWIAPALEHYYEQPWWFGILFCVFASQILWGSYYAVFAAVACRIAARSAGAARVLLIAAAWVGAELARARLMTGEPWLLLGYALVPQPAMIQIADVGGVYLLSFVVMVVNAAAAEVVAVAAATGSTPAILSRTRAPLLVAAGLVAGVWVYGHVRLGQDLAPIRASRVAVIQGNVELGSQWRQDLYAKGLREYLALSAEAARQTRPEVLIWPESAVTFFLAEDRELLEPILAMLRATGAELIVGGPHLDRADPAGPRFFNSAFLVTGPGISGRYDKAHLLPFGEYFPLKAIELLRRRFERVRVFTPGAGDTFLDTRAGRAAVVICFEAVFPEIVRERMRRGAEILVNLSNDAWLAGSGPQQHASMVVLRAVENRTWVVRATTTGISSIIDPYGRVVAESGENVVATLAARVQALRVATPYQVLGDAFAYGCVLAAVAAALLPLRRRALAARIALDSTA